mmetsp:Transcript_8811/g.19020  ORF Transcript_8811/g.19020 Transcript_8811/m.19020 type:complete len:82 (+) Transcript_8811:555-800(+)
MGRRRSLLTTLTSISTSTLYRQKGEKRRRQPHFGLLKGKAIFRKRRMGRELSREIVGEMRGANDAQIIEKRRRTSEAGGIS